MSQKFYNLKPQFYLDLFDSNTKQSCSNKNLKILEFEHKLKKALSGWHTQLLFDSSFLENPNLNDFIKITLNEKNNDLKNEYNTDLKKQQNSKLESQYNTGLKKQHSSSLESQHNTDFRATSISQTKQKEISNPNYNIKPVLQISPDQFKKYKAQILELSKTYKNKLDFHIICEDDKTFSIKELEDFNSSFSFVWIVTNKNKNKLLKKFIDKFSNFSNNTDKIKNANSLNNTDKINNTNSLNNTDSFKNTNHLNSLAESKDTSKYKNWFYFPYKKNLFDSFLTPRQVYNFIRECPNISVYPVEVYDNRIPQDMDLEPYIQPFIQNNLPKKNIYFSVIIPSYNSQSELINSLKNLTLQDFPRDQYEIIAVDDGSSDDTKQALSKFVQQHPSLNIKALYFPRVIERKTGDSRFRAGLARNLGAKHSLGKILAFLDSDILTPPDYLTRLKKEHEKADLILLKRYHLKEKTKIEDLFSNHKNLKNFYYIEDKKYWGDFYKKGFDQVSCPWKYVCTYALSLSKKDFIDLGAFGKNFIFYGFEDTDLGYRMFKQNKKFSLSDIIVYHQAPLDKINRGWNYPLLRQKQLAKTAKIFFYRHLKPDIYKQLSAYMRQERPISYFLPF